MGTGVNVSKAVAYSVVQPPTGVGVSKAVAYSIVVPPTGVSLGKIVAYSVVSTAPYITNASPNPILAGQTLTLTGINFNNATVAVGGQSALGVVNVSDTQITLTVPDVGFGVRPVVVTNADGFSSDPFYITMSNPQPKITIAKVDSNTARIIYLGAYVGWAKGDYLTITSPELLVPNQGTFVITKTYADTTQSYAEYVNTNALAAGSDSVSLNSVIYVRPLATRLKEIPSTAQVSSDKIAVPVSSRICERDSDNATYLGVNGYVQTKANRQITSTRSTVTISLLQNQNVTLLPLQDATAFPDAPGWIRIGLGHGYQTDCRYLGKSGGALLLDPAFSFPKTIPSGEDVYLLDTTPNPNPKDAWVLTDNVAAFAAVQDSLKSVLAAGMKVDIVPKYPSDRGLGGAGTDHSDIYDVWSE